MIDLDKLRASLRNLRNEDLFYLLDAAIERLSPGELEEVVRPYLDLEQLRRSAPEVEPPGLLARVRAFAEATRAGEFFESFDVNSKNYTELSRGTMAWISTHGRLLDRCVAEAGSGDPSEVLAAMGVLFELLELLDEGCEELLFFADEGGSWLVGADWRRVLPAWLQVLSRNADPEGFTAAVLERHRRMAAQRAGLLELAEQLATPAQAAALAARIGAVPPGAGGPP